MKRYCQIVDYLLYIRQRCLWKVHLPYRASCLASVHHYFIMLTPFARHGAEILFDFEMVLF